MGADVVVEDLRKEYGSADGVRITALGGVTFSAAPGNAVAVTGPSGSGKSTLLHIIGAMDGPDSGTVRVGSTNVTGLPRREMAAYRRTVGFVFQRFHLLPALTALDNVVAPLLPYKTDFDVLERGRELLAAVGLDGREDSIPSRLSGGEQQRVAIARALINNPRLVLADEPTGNLDSATSEEIIDLLLDVRSERGMTILVATHNPLVASRCDRIVRLQDGRVVDEVEVPHDSRSDAVLERISRLDIG